MDDPDETPRWSRPREDGRPRLCLLLTRSLCRAGRDPFEQVLRAVDAGLELVQLREKERGANEILEDLARLHEILKGSGAEIALNDRPDWALTAGVQTVHLGQEDTPPALARRLPGGEKLFLGLSTHTLDEAHAAGADAEVDSIGIGPLFPTTTKGYTRGIGPEQARAMQEAAAKPAFWIGGITPERAPLLRGAFGFAIGAALLGAERPEEVVRALRG